jgi:integrase
VGLLLGGWEPLDANNVAKVFKRGLKAAGLPLHFTPHGLRHSFASLLLSAQVSPAYVQRQLGHASIKLTVDTYGRWLPIGNKAAIDGLDDEGVLRISAADESRPDTAP